MFRTIRLYGAAKQRFGGPFRLDVATPAGAVRALCAMIKGFDAFIRASDWKVIRGRGAAGRRISADELGFQFGTVEELHLVPVAAGSVKGKGAGKVVLGLALAAAAVAFAPAGAGGGIAFGAEAIGGSGVTFGSIALTGVGMVLGGVSQMLAKTPMVKGYSGREPADVSKPSFLFNGPVNTVAQGATIPVICGRRVRVGSVVISAGIFTERFVPT